MRFIFYRATPVTFRPSGGTNIRSAIYSFIYKTQPFLCQRTPTRDRQCANTNPRQAVREHQPETGSARTPTRDRQCTNTNSRQTVYEHQPGTDSSASMKRYTAGERRKASEELINQTDRNQYLLRLFMFHLSNPTALYAFGL